jgi:catechol 2,3-dioxygenase-like lactoylglutathione lyase family enzyme
MHTISIVANLRVADIETAKSFYTDYLGLSSELFSLGWVSQFASPAASGTRTTDARLQLVTHDATSPEDSVISVHTDDVEGAFEEALERGYEIVHPLTTEAWGVRRFFVRAPDGTVVNIVRHAD